MQEDVVFVEKTELQKSLLDPMLALQFRLMAIQRGSSSDIQSCLELCQSCLDSGACMFRERESSRDTPYPR